MVRKKKRKPRFAVGDRVRVKPGTIDLDFPDIPIGGWAGEIAERETGTKPLYLVEWNRQTLESLHPVYRKRCEAEGLEYEHMWLPEDELETDTGAPLKIEQPTKIVTRPLDPKNEDDRIRVVLDLTSDDPLPEVDFDTLRKYREYLAEHLSFPFEAEWETESGPLSMRRQKVKVTGLGDPDEDFRLDDMYGLICEIRIEGRSGDAPLAELEVKKRSTNRKLVKDYCTWFWNNR